MLFATTAVAFCWIVGGILFFLGYEFFRKRANRNLARFKQVLKLNGERTSMLPNPVPESTITDLVVVVFAWPVVLILTTVFFISNVFKNPQ